MNSRTATGLSYLIISLSLFANGCLRTRTITATSSESGASILSDSGTGSPAIQTAAGSTLINTQYVSVISTQFVSIINTQYVTVTSTQSVSAMNTQVVTVVSDPNEMILKYREFLQKETTEHREFVESIYKLIGVLFAFLLGIAAFLGFRSWKELKELLMEEARKMADEGIKSAIGGALEKRMKWIEGTHKESNKKIFRELKSLFKKQVTGHLPKVENAEILKNKKVLWVDDDLPGIACQIAVLECLHMNVTVAQSTQEAIAEIAKDGYSIVVTNMNRDPDSIAGIHLAKKIRVDSKIPILVYTREEHIKNHGEKAKEAGVNALVSDPDSIVVQVEALIKAHQNR